MKAPDPMDYSTNSEADRVAIARGWLGPAHPDGVDLYIRTREGQVSEFESRGPRFVKLRINTEFLAMLMRRHALCETEAIIQMAVGLDNADVEYGHLTDYTMWSWNLQLSKDDFTVLGNPDMSPNMSTEPVNTELLGEHLAGTSSFRPDPDVASGLTSNSLAAAAMTAAADADDDLFRWHGGALFYDNGSNPGDSMGDFVDLVTEQVPELAAQEAAIQLELAMSMRMAAGLGASPDVGSPDVAESKNRRRKAF